MALSQIDVITAAQMARAVYNKPADWSVYSEADTTWLAIEGSDCGLDWRRNLEFLLSSDDQHLGFKNYSTRLMAEMLASGVYFSRAKHLIVTGHSLGGAVATIIAAALQNQIPQLDLVTFGSPRPGGRKFRQRLRVPHKRFVHGNDVVPQLPLPAFGFRHTAPAEHLVVPGDRLIDGVKDHAMDGYLLALLYA